MVTAVLALAWEKSPDPFRRRRDRRQRAIWITAPRAGVAEVKTGALPFHQLGNDERPAEAGAKAAIRVRRFLRLLTVQRERRRVQGRIVQIPVYRAHVGRLRRAHAVSETRVLAAIGTVGPTAVSPAAAGPAARTPTAKSSPAAAARRATTESSPVPARSARSARTAGTAIKTRASAQSVGKPGIDRAGTQAAQTEAVAGWTAHARR